MRIAFGALSVTAISVLAISLLGCGSRSTETPGGKIAGSPPPLACDTDHDDHDGHDHGDDATHEHPTEGPHDGHLVELGNEEYHAELLHDENTRTVTIHLLDAVGKQPVAVPQSEVAVQLSQGAQFVKYALKTVPGEGGAAGASEFMIVDEKLCDALSHEDDLRGRLQVTINGKAYTGTIEHASHGDHDHEGHDTAGYEHG